MLNSLTLSTALYHVSLYPAVQHFTAFTRLPEIPHIRAHFVLYRVKHVVVNVLNIFLYDLNQNSLLFTLGWLSLSLSLLFFFTSHITIFQSYMWRHRCAGGLKKKLYLRSGSQRHIHFAGFFNVPVIHRHGTNLFIRWFRHAAPFRCLLRHAGDTEDVFWLKPHGVSTGALGWQNFEYRSH